MYQSSLESIYKYKNVTFKIIVMVLKTVLSACDGVYSGRSSLFKMKVLSQSSGWKKE
jgi:hypothetical protein